MRIVGGLIRIYSLLYHLVLCLFLLGISAVSKISGQDLKLEMLPWKGAELSTYLLVGSLLGLMTVILAVTRAFRFLFPIWAAVVLFLMFRGFFLSSYAFAGPAEFKSVAWLVVGAAGAFLGSLMEFKPLRRDRR